MVQSLFRSLDVLRCDKVVFYHIACAVHSFVDIPKPVKNVDLSPDLNTLMLSVDANKPTYEIFAKYGTLIDDDLTL